MLTTKQIDEIIKNSGVPRYEFAMKAEVSEFYFCRLFRSELNDKWKEKIILVIKEVLEEKKNNINKLIQFMEEKENESN